MDKKIDQIMQVESTLFEGLLIIKPRIFIDDRGYFFESFNQEIFKKAGLNMTFAQDNQSGSIKNVVRGLHFQVPPYEQGKLVRAIRGSVLDVVVDLRKNQPTFGKHLKIIINDKDKHMLFIPPGFAHGFRTLENDTVFFYKCTKVFNPQSERTIRWNDSDLAIDWGITDPILSEKDKNASFFKDFVSPF